MWYLLPFPKKLFYLTQPFPLNNSISNQNRFMRRVYSTLCTLAMAVFFFGCQKELSNIGNPDPLPVIPVVIPPDPITAALQGNVFDDAGAPAPGVTVQVGSKTAITNANGYFRIDDAPLDKKASLVAAAKAGFFKAYRSFSATSGANYVNIKLVKKVLTGTINAASGGDASLSNGSKVTLPANGVVNASTNAAYTGTVNVYASYIDPSAADISQTVPGSFMATDKAGNRVTLESYGMLAVELESASGEKLQIKSGSSATLTTAIPAANLASAPATIALWSIDETTGLWKEEGTATKSGNVYVGSVSHFSFWNCDISIPTVTLSLTLKNAAGSPLVHAGVRIKRSNNTTAYGYTDSLGQVSGLVPKNETLTLDVIDQCNTSFYTQNVGPYSVNTNLGVITLTNTGNSIVTIKGKLVNCSAAAVTNGFAIITYGYYTHYASLNAAGDFETTFLRCGTSPTTYSLIGVDNAAQQQSVSLISGTLTLPVTNTGNISACGTSSAQFINYTLDGTNYSVPTTSSPMAYSASNGTAQPTTYISANDSTVSGGNSNRFSFNFSSPTQTVGTYPVNNLLVQNYIQGNTLIQPFDVIITNFALNTAEFYEGSFSGQFKDAGNVTHSISATFRVRRSF